MTVSQLTSELKEALCRDIQLKEDGVGRFWVLTPFQFDDGDHPTVLLKTDVGQRYLSDEGRTFLRLTYEIDERELRKGNRQKIITDTLSYYQVDEVEGELRRKVGTDLGAALCDFIQAILKVTDVSLLSRELVYTTFIQDFKSFIGESPWAERTTYGWSDPVHDPQGKYPVDCRINGLKRPIFIYTMTTDDSVRDAHISLLEFERWKIDFHSIGVFEDMERVGRKVHSRFADVCEKTYSALAPNRERIQEYITKVISLQS